jgi:hypothetical protein
MAKKPERRSITLPRARGDEERQITVGVNGKFFTIPRGKEVEVPQEVYYEIMRSRDAENFMLDQQDELRSLAKQQ